jgi:hypothetical protein
MSVKGGLKVVVKSEDHSCHHSLPLSQVARVLVLATPSMALNPHSLF